MFRADSRRGIVSRSSLGKELEVGEGVGSENVETKQHMNYFER